MGSTVGGQKQAHNVGITKPFSGEACGLQSSAAFAFVPRDDPGA